MPCVLPNHILRKSKIRVLTVSAIFEKLKIMYLLDNFDIIHFWDKLAPIEGRSNMVIEKLASAIRRQDWFQVIIEVLIVVLGIFIGLQVDAWNTERKERLEGAEYLDRLYQDLEYDVSHFTRMKQEALNKQTQLEILADVIESGNHIREYTHTLSDGTVKAIDFYRSLENSVQFGWSVPSVRTTTFHDLQNSGKISMIENSDLRYAISYYYEETLIIRNRLLARLTGYSQSVYEMLEAGERTVFAGELEPTGFELILPTLQSEQAIGDFIDKARTPEFQALLNAEKNYTGFLLIQLDLQLEYTRQLMGQIDTAHIAS